MPASNFFNAITQGLNFKDQRANDERERAYTDEQRRIEKGQQFVKLDRQRQEALFKDARTVNSYLKSGQQEQALNLLSSRAQLAEQLGGDSSDTREIANLIGSGDINGAVSLLDSVEQAGVVGGFLSDPLDRDIKQAQLDKLTKSNTATQQQKKVQNSRDVPGGTIITFTDGSQSFKRFGEEVNEAALAVSQRDLPKLTSSLQNKQLEFQESANNAYSLADKTSLLADRFAKSDITTGAAGSARESLLNFVGGQDEISNLRKDYTRIRNKLITANLPQGPATDKDIELIADGFPPASASQAQIVDFLKAMSRGQEAVAKFDEFKSLFLQETGNITRATRDFEFDGQKIKKGERLAPAYKRISKKITSKTDSNIAKQEEAQAQQPASNSSILRFDAQGNQI